MSNFIIKDAVCTSHYGVKRNVKLANGSTLVDVHNGLDIVSTSGKRELYPLFDNSKVLFTTDDLPAKHDGTGCRTIVVGSNYNNIGMLLILYAHCDEIYVKTGEKVNRSKVLGLYGSTGNVSGPHCHCSMYLISMNKYHDIETGKWFSWMGDNMYKERANYQFDPNTLLKLYK